MLVKSVNGPQTEAFEKTVPEHIRRLAASHGTPLPKYFIRSSGAIDDAPPQELIRSEAEAVNDHIDEVLRAATSTES